MKFLREAPCPIIVTATDIWDKKFAGIRNECEKIEMKRINKASVRKHLKSIAKLENLDIPDEKIQEIAENDVSVNVHFQPLPLLTAYKKRGYNMSDYPEAYSKYANEISLPVYFDLSDSDVQTVINTVVAAVNKVMG